MRFYIEIPDSIQTPIPLSQLESEVKYDITTESDDEFFLSDFWGLVKSRNLSTGARRLIFSRKPGPEPPKWLNKDMVIGTAIYTRNNERMWVLGGDAKYIHVCREQERPNYSVLDINDFEEDPENAPSPEMMKIFEGKGHVS